MGTVTRSRAWRSPAAMWVPPPTRTSSSRDSGSSTWSVRSMTSVEKARKCVDRVGTPARTEAVSADQMVDASIEPDTSVTRISRQSAERWARRRNTGRSGMTWTVPSSVRAGGGEVGAQRAGRSRPPPGRRVGRGSRRAGERGPQPGGELRGSARRPGGVPAGAGRRAGPRAGRPRAGARCAAVRRRGVRLSGSSSAHDVRTARWPRRRAPPRGCRGRTARRVPRTTRGRRGTEPPARPPACAARQVAARALAAARCRTARPARSPTARCPAGVDPLAGRARAASGRRGRCGGHRVGRETESAGVRQRTGAAWPVGRVGVVRRRPASWQVSASWAGVCPASWAGVCPASGAGGRARPAPRGRRGPPSSTRPASACPCPGEGRRRGCRRGVPRDGEQPVAGGRAERVEAAAQGGEPVEEGAVGQLADPVEQRGERPGAVSRSGPAAVSRPVSRAVSSARVPGSPAASTQDATRTPRAVAGSCPSRTRTAAAAPRISGVPSSASRASASASRMPPEHVGALGEFDQGAGVVRVLGAGEPVDLRTAATVRSSAQSAGAWRQRAAGAGFAAGSVAGSVVARPAMWPAPRRSVRARPGEEFRERADRGQHVATSPGPRPRGRAARTRPPRRARSAPARRSGRPPRCAARRVRAARPRPPAPG